MNVIDVIKNELSWTGTEWIVKELNGKIGVAGFYYEKDWGEVCGVESTYDMVDEAIWGLKDELNLTIDDSCEADDLIHENFDLEDTDDFMGERTGWLCAVVSF